RAQGSVRAVESVLEDDVPDPESDRRSTGRKSEYAGRGPTPEAVGLKRDDVRPLRACGDEHALPQRGRRLRGLGREGERGRAGRERRELRLTAPAVCEVLLVRPLLGRIERIERVARGQLVEGVVRHVSPFAGASSSSCRRVRPANIRLLIVPSGWPSLSANSDCVKPP